jgi:ankyrin repeat protein
MMIASQHGHDQVVQCLLSAGAEVDAALPNGETALSMASLRRLSNVVKTLLSAGPAVNAATTDGVTSLYMATQNGHPDIVELLLTHGAELNRTFKGSQGRTLTAATMALAKGHLTCLRLLFKAGADLSIGSPSTFEVATGPDASHYSPACITFIKQAQQATTLLHELEAYLAVGQVDEACALISEPANVKLRVVKSKED